MKYETLPSPSSSVIYGNAPASDWAESFPLGNGRIGAMARCHPTQDVISMNHDLLWRKFLKQPDMQTSRDIPEISRLSLEKNWYEAEQLAYTTMPKITGCLYINPFIPAFDCYLNMFHQKDISDYRRTLDMEHGIAYVRYKCGDDIFTRTMFCAKDAGVFVTHIHTSAPGSLMGEVSISRMPDQECTVTGGSTLDEIYLEGTLEEGFRFAGVTRVIQRHGRMTSGKKVYGYPGEESIFPDFSIGINDVGVSNASLRPESKTGRRQLGFGYIFDRDEQLDPSRGASVIFDSSDEVIIVTAIATEHESDDPISFCRDKIKGFTQNAYKDIRTAHKEQFSSYYNRVRLNLAPSDAFDCPLEERVEKVYRNGGLTPETAEVAFNTARYVAISSGMPQHSGLVPKAPINLQGLWNRDSRPGWDSDYHNDVNLQMYYWVMGSAGLLEFFEPFTAFQERILPTMQKAARDVYGARGATNASVSDPFTLGRGDHMCWLGGGGWLGQILWIAYEYIQTQEYLERIYPLLQEYAAFYQDLFIRTEDGWLSFPFGHSPEMRIVVDGRAMFLSSASTIDLTLTQELFLNLSKAAELLGEPEKSKQYLSIANQIHPPVIAPNGRMQEWVENHEEFEPGHRHRSPFVGLCPGGLFSVETTPDITKALENLLDYRLSQGTSGAAAFSFGWDAQILSRLQRGNDSWDRVEEYLKIHMINGVLISGNGWRPGNGGLTWFPGLKQIQVDGQLGLISAISEWFYQDMQGIIRLLPALPDAVASGGSLCGIQGRYGFRGDLFWNEGQLKQFRLYSKLGKTCKIKYSGPDGGHLKITHYGNEVPYTTDDLGVCTFDTMADEYYLITYEK